MGADLGFSIAAVILVLLAGGFAAIDTALLTVSRARVEDLVKEKRGGAYRLLRVVDRRATYVALVVLLRVASETTAAVLAAVVLTDTLGLAWGLVAAALVMTILSYIAAGVGPRTLGRQHAYSIGIFAAPLLTSIGVLLRPVTRLLILIGNALTPGRGFRNGPFATEVELREVVDLAEAQGVVDPDERRMIQSVFELGNTTAREVMVPRPEMVWIESDKTAGQAVSLAVRSGHSRVPVIGVNPDDIRGVLYLKDIVAKELEAPSALRDITVDQLMRPAEFIPDTKPLDAVLADMQKLRNHMALLVDEYGGIAGLVTIEDVIEEIVGEISDEYDVDEVAPIAELGNDRYRVSARLTVEELGALFDIDIDPDDIDDVETVGGLIALELGRVPLPGARVESNGLVLLAEGGPNRQGRQRIASVVAHRAVQPADEPPTERRSREKRAPEKKSAEKKNPEKKNAEKKNADKKTAAKKTAEKRSTDQKAAESTARPEGAEA